jgi:hypothetical protein
MSGANRPQLKHGTFEELMKVDARGGRVISLAEFDLSKPGVRWSQNGLAMEYQPVPSTEYGCYKMNILDPKAYLVAMSRIPFKALPNRNYVISALIYTKFSRDGTGGKPTRELNLGVYGYGPKSTDPTSDLKANLGNFNGLPDDTGGWARWEWEYTSSPLGGDTQFWFRPFEPGDADFRIADFKVIELPARPLVPFAKGEGVTFKGGPGKLPMQVKSVSNTATGLLVETTGARYTFNVKDSTITAEQFLEKKRVVSTWKLSQPLANLSVLKKNSKECVLANGNLTAGVQCDGLMVISPQKDLDLTLTSALGGRWNRLIGGNLLVLDDFGGFTVNPALPLGSGRIPRVDVLTQGLDFPGKLCDTNFLSHAQPGWQMKWSLSPGERLGISVFPPRPFEWKQSFHSNYTLSFSGQQPSVYEKVLKPNQIDIALLWDFTVRSWGMQWGPKAIPSDENWLMQHIKAAKAAGMKPLTYFSAYFYYSRDPDEYIAELARWKNTYGIEGFYTDGIPDIQWIVAYEEMRMARELFPDGAIIVHTTGQSSNGGPPMALPDIFMPCIDTYATATLRGEFVPSSSGDGWPYPQYITSQYRKANCLGILKGDRWKEVPQARQDSINLLYNGRARYLDGGKVNGPWHEQYLPKLRALEALWDEKGSDPEFYEKYYLPKAQELTGITSLPAKD